MALTEVGRGVAVEGADAFAGPTPDQKTKIVIAKVRRRLGRSARRQDVEAFVEDFIKLLMLRISAADAGTTEAALGSQLASWLNKRKGQAGYKSASKEAERFLKKVEGRKSG